MFGPLASLMLLLAQVPAPAAGQQSPSLLVQLIPFLPVIPLFYFLLLRPQQQQEKKRKEMINTLERNDKVLTVGGIYGTVLSVNPKNDRVILRLDDDGKLKATFTKASVVRVFRDGSEKSSEVA